MASSRYGNGTVNSIIEQRHCICNTAPFERPVRCPKNTAAETISSGCCFMKGAVPGCDTHGSGLVA